MAISSGLPIKQKRFLSYFWAILLVYGSIGAYFHPGAVGNLMDSVKSRLLNSAAFISQTLDAGPLDSIQGFSDTTSPVYIDRLKKLRALKRTDKDVAFLYIMRRQADKIVFVIDTDETDRQAKPGDPCTTVPDGLYSINLKES